VSEKNVVTAIRDALRDAMTEDDRVVVLGEDVGARGGVFRVTEGFQDLFGEARVIDTPLAENAIVGIAVGMALDGLRPVAEIEFADFIHPAFDQIVSEVARMRYRTNGDWGLPLVIRAPWGGGVHGALYHSQSIESFYAHIPGLKVVAPSTPADAAGMLRAAIDDPDPVLFLEHKRTYRLVKGEVPDGASRVAIGPVDVKRQGEDLSVYAYGLMLQHCLEAADRGRVLRGGRRRADARAARSRGHPRLRAPDGEGPRRPRGQPDLRRRRGDRGDDRGGGPLRPRCPARAPHRPGLPRDAVQPGPRARVPPRRRPHPRGDARAREVLTSLD
jgi:transketolase C-terminal domain/subunit